jgi:hypothetical protein
MNDFKFALRQLSKSPAFAIAALATMIADLQFRVQSLAKNPSFAAAVVIGLGIGAKRSTSRRAC